MTEDTVSFSFDNVNSIYTPRLTTRQWLDAYTVHLESLAAAISSPYLEHILCDAYEEAISRAKATGDETDYKIAEEQQVANERSGVGKFNLERYRRLRQIWNTIVQAFLLQGFDLTSDIEVERITENTWKLEQKAHGVKAQWLCDTEHMQVFMAFIGFVNAMSTVEHPVKYVQKTLEKHGITKENWHLHASRFMIRDPWAHERNN